MFGLVEPYSGHFFLAEYYEYDTKEKAYKPAKKIRIKGQSAIGISTGVKETIPVTESGRTIDKEVFRVNVVEVHNYKRRDKVKFLETDTTYVVERVSDDILHPNGISSIMFPKSDKRPKVLFLGE